MKQLLILLFTLLSVASYGQGLPIQVNIRGYRGNPVVSDTIRFSPADTANLSVIARPAVGSGLTNPQPILVRKGLSAVVRFASSSTLPELSRYEIMAGGVVRFYGDITVNKQGIVFPIPGGSILSGIYSQLGVPSAL